MKDKSSKQIGSVRPRKPIRLSMSDDEEYYDNSDLKRMFNVSDSTLYRMRMEGILPYAKLRGKIYYPKKYFNKTFLQKCMKKLVKPVD